MLDFKYKVFLSAGRLLSFSKAAKEISLTQPAVSFQIRHLEEELGTRLFLRYPNRIELSPVGEMLLKELEQMEGYAEQAHQRVMKKLDKFWGTVEIGASTTVGDYFLPPVLAEFKTEYDEVGLKVLVGNTNEVLGYLADGLVDFAIVEGPVKTRQWEVQAAFLDELVIIAPRDFYCMGDGFITKKQLAGQPFISREPGSGTRAVIDSIKDGEKLLVPKSNIVLELGSNTAIKRVVESGLGISIVSKMTIAREVANKSLSVIRVKDFPIYRQISFVFNRGVEKTDLVSKMVKLCERRAREVGLENAEGKNNVY